MILQALNIPWQDHLPKEAFQRYLLASFLAHGVFILAFSIKPILFSRERIEFKNAIQVDVIALPDKLTAPAPSAKTPPSVLLKKDAKPQDNKKTLNRQAEALKKLEALKAVDKIKKQLEQEKLAKEAAEKAKQEVLKKGNVLSPGTGVAGLAKIEFDRYLADIQVRVKNQWNLPQFLADANLKAQVLAFIDERGYIIDKKILAPSGNDVFDATVLAALENSSPLPEPPDRLTAILKADGIVFNFP